MGKESTPLLLLDNSSMGVIGQGTYKVENISFEEARGIIEVFDSGDIIRCFTDRAIDQVIHDYLGVDKREFEYKKFRCMRPGQMAIAFKQYITSSATQPIVSPENGVEAKKIQNIYVYCESVTRIE